MLRILLLASNPLDTKRLALDEESREIREKLRAGSGRSRIDLQCRTAARPDDLLHELNEYQPHVVHFSGHGEGDPGIVLSGVEGTSQLVTGTALRRLFSVLKDNIRVVVLSACYSEVQANEIATVIDFVVGMQHGIDDDAARVFASSFYRALAFGRSVGNAFEQGRASISLHGLPDEDSPKLLTRAGIDASTEFLLDVNSGADTPDLSSLPSRARPQPPAEKPQSAEALGLFDYREALEDEGERLNEIGSRIAAAMERFTTATTQMTARTGAIAKRGGSAVTKNARKALDDYADVMDTLTDSLRAELPQFSASIDAGIGAMGSITTLMRDELSPSKETVEGNAVVMRDLKAKMQEALGGLVVFRDGLGALPRMTQRLNTSRRESIQVLAGMIAKIEDGIRILEAADATTNDILANLAAAQGSQAASSAVTPALLPAATNRNHASRPATGIKKRERPSSPPTKARKKRGE